MVEYTRSYPLFALCGLNCGLCPRYHTEGSSRCPGCGGTDFHLKHPSCAVINCSKKHGQFEYCFDCPDYPCRKYHETGNKDSFITYRNVVSDLEKAKTQGIQKYREELDRKIEILNNLIEKYNDGRRKNLFCLAVNLLPLKNLEDIILELTKQIVPDKKSAAEAAEKLLKDSAAKLGTELELRK